MSSTQNPVDFYKFFAVEPTKEVKDNYVATCPFADCNKPNHFFFNKTNGLFNCKKCNRSGNYFSFITEFHKSLKDFTTSEDYEFLQTERGIPTEVFQLAHWYRNPSTGRWYVPYYGPNGLLNLGAFNPDSYNPKNRFRIFKSPGLDLQLYYLQSSKLGQDVFITEGEWDALALYSAFRALRKDSPSILGLPGATSWKQEWNTRFKGKSLTFFYDRDKGGDDGVELLRKRSLGLRYSIANWEAPSLSKLKLVKKGVELKDVRDVWTNAKTKSEVLSVLLDMAATTKEDVSEDSAIEEEGDAVKKAFSVDVDSIPPITSFSLFQKNIKDSLYTNKSILQTIQAILATALSVRLPGEPLWLFVVGPASCGKSTVIEAFGGENKYFSYSSKLTSKSLVSGWRNQDGSDASTLHKLDMKSLFIKDMTVLLGMPQGVQQELWDLLRDAYDGYIKVQYGNGKVFEATDFKFNIIAGVTPIIYKHNDASSGERFLRIDFLGSDFDEDAHMDMAWDGASVKRENKTKLQNTMLGYYKHLYETFDPENTAEIPEAIRQKIKALAKMVARLQTEVVKDRNEGMIYRPQSAIATRLQLQFKNYILSLAHVRGEKVVSEETYDIVRKTGFDSCPGLNLEVVDHLRKVSQASRKDLVNKLKIPSTRIHQIVTDLEQLGIIHQGKENNNSGNRGRDTYVYTLSEELVSCLETARVKANNKTRASGKPASRGNSKRPSSKRKQATK